MAGRLQRIAAGLTALAVTTLCAPAASADNAGRPMTFEWGMTYGDVPAIFGDGDFTIETPEALRTFLKRSIYSPDTVIYLNSLGGDLGAGMEVGRIIREAHLNTGVARNSRDASQANTIDLDAFSPCLSRILRQRLLACLSRRRVARGEARRDLRRPPGGDELRRQAQGALAIPVGDDAQRELLPRTRRSAGAWCRSPAARWSSTCARWAPTPIFLSEMSKAGPSAINALTEDQLKDYKINFTMRTESWSYETDAQGQFFLQYRQGDEWKEDRVEIYCNRTAAPRLFLWLVHDTRRSTGRSTDARRVVALAKRACR